MIRKTYGVSGLMDWITQIKAGKGAVLVHFTGGALTAYGVTPAKYTTSNPFFQRVIEGSEQYKSGRIELIGELEIPDNRSAKARKPQLTASSEKSAATQDYSIEEGEPVDKIEVADKNEAIEYMKEHFATKNYTATNLRTKSAFEAACKECGVDFVFTA